MSKSESKPELKQSLIQLRNSIGIFIGNVIVNNETHLYNFFINNFEDELEILVTPNESIYQIISLLTEDYYNDYYNKCVLNENDQDNKNKSEELLELEKLCTFCNHNPICLLKIITELTYKLHMKIDRLELNAMTVEKYIDSISVQVNWCSTDINMTQALMHECDDLHHKQKFIPLKKMFDLGCNFTFDMNLNSDEKDEKIIFS
jgi:hypothetical protein